jgi:hypothetical protein
MAGGKVVPMLDTEPHHQDVWDSGVGCLHSYLEWTAPCLAALHAGIQPSLPFGMWLDGPQLIWTLQEKEKIFASAKN